jgi:predicted DNA-binding antitoxin AbrB/MazE fold protein
MGLEVFMSATEQDAQTQTIEAVYEHGVFRLINSDAVEIPEGQRVRLTVEPLTNESQQDSLELLLSVYAGLSEEEIDEIETIILDRGNWSRNSSA